ncbi:MAG: EFR1 family ferrodoxin [Methanomicrobiaceae archaeon]|nr:EFR1 family ferrodoxin [Methanomicrobiaceae archaeon]
MKTIIYYFTGTGNTLAVARGIAEELGDVQLIPIRKSVHPEEGHDEADAIGIAFPVYFLNIPDIVRDFVENIRFYDDSYVFGIATCGEQPGGALFRLKELLEEKGNTLSAGFSFVMPENYIGPVDLMGDALHREKKFAAASERYPEIAAKVREQVVSVPEGTDSVLMKTGGRIMKTVMTSVYRTPCHLHTAKTCNRCGTCAQICPTGNITVSADKVSWGKDCVQCYACIHWCPKEAVDIGGRTKGKPRYHHPDVTLKDMLEKPDSIKEDYSKIR